MTQTFPRRTRSSDWGDPTGVGSGRYVALDLAPTRLGTEPSAQDPLAPIPAAQIVAAPALPGPISDEAFAAAAAVHPLAPIDQETWGKGPMRSRIRLGLGFAFLVSLLFHSSLLSLFTGGTVPGAEDGREAISVEIITQEQLDILMGSGSAKGGKPPEVEVADTGMQTIQQTLSQSASQKSDSEAEQQEALRIIAAAGAPDQLRVGTANQMNAAASATPRRPERKATAQGSQKESKPSRKTAQKDKPDSDREDARNELEPSPSKPGSDGGEMRRVASRGGVGDELGPLPPSMKQALMQLLQKQIELCYVPPASGAKSAELPLILIRLGRDGSLEEVPKSVRFDRSPAGKSLVNAALKAVRQCAPYRLPPRFAPYYGDWKEIRAEFEFSSR